jgi:hypothetical protein
MRWPPKKVIMAVVIIAIILLIWSGRSPSTASTEFLTDRVWIDRVTEEPRELVDMMFFAHRGEFGMTGKSSHYRLTLDSVQWNLDGDRLGIHELQEDRRTSHQVKTWRCQEGEAPSEDFEYCMSLTGPNGSKKFYAKDQDDEALRALIDARLP